MASKYKKQYEIDDKTTYHREYHMSKSGTERYWGGEYEVSVVHHELKESVEYKRAAGSLVVEFTRDYEYNDWNEHNLSMDDIVQVNIYTQKKSKHNLLNKLGMFKKKSIYSGPCYKLPDDLRHIKDDASKIIEEKGRPLHKQEREKLNTEAKARSEVEKKQEAEKRQLKAAQKVAARAKKLKGFEL